MRILLTTFFYDELPFNAFLDHMCKWLIDNFPKNQIDVKFLVTENYYEEAIAKSQEKSYSPILITNQELDMVFEKAGISNAEKIKILNNNQFSCKYSSNLKNLLVEKCGNWIPDLIIEQGYTAGCKIWNNIFKNALCLTTENAIFSRPPFKRTISYDPFNSAPYNFLVKYTNEIRAVKINKQQNVKIKKLKSRVTKLINNLSPLDKEMAFYKNKFKKLLLIPLVGNKFVELFEGCFYKSESELINSVLSSIPSNYGLIVTQHDTAGSLRQEDIEYFSAKYPNFIFLQKTNIKGFTSNSLYYFKYIDAVINITSKTAFFALLWNKPVLSLAKEYNDWFKDGQGIEDLEKVLSKPVIEKNNILYWYLTHYVLFEQDFYKKDFLFNYMKDKIRKYRTEGITFDFFDEINDMNKVIDYIIQPIIENDYSRATHHVIKFLGMKISFRKRKKH